jgi:hypothetical protein
MKEVNMTTATQNKTHKPIQADALTPSELEELRECIFKVRSGQREYNVLLTNRKQTKSKKRLPGQHYDPNPALAPHAHKGWLVAAPTNKKGEVYLHLYDEARAQARGDGFGHTRVTLRGLRSFEVLGERDGPLAPDEPQTAQATAQAVGLDPRVLMAQAMLMQAAGLNYMAQALMAQAQTPNTSL